eukprot:2673389-Pyramimonas_sp.AAC.1
MSPAPTRGKRRRAVVDGVGNRAAGGVRPRAHRALSAPVPTCEAAGPVCFCVPGKAAASKKILDTLLHKHLWNTPRPRRETSAIHPRSARAVDKIVQLRHGSDSFIYNARAVLGHRAQGGKEPRNQHLRSGRAEEPQTFFNATSRFVTC